MLISCKYDASGLIPRGSSIRPTYGGELIKREKMAKQGIEGLLHSTVHLLCYVANLSLKKPLLALHSIAQSKI